MIVSVGSKNPVKIVAVEEALREYGYQSDMNVWGVAADSGVGAQPKMLAETKQGAENRARNAYVMKPCDVAVGLESGTMAIPGAEGMLWNVTVCVIFDGSRCGYGLSGGFVVPDILTAFMHEHSCDLTEACYKSGFACDRTLGKREGLVGLLTKGSITRKSITKQAVMFALIPFKGSLAVNI